jgi:hypothetical protein
MSKWLEIFQQQDGGYCALQVAIVSSFTLFWLVWAYLCLSTGVLVEIPVGLAGTLTAMLGAKVWKDYVDFRQPPTP